MSKTNVSRETKYTLLEVMSDGTEKRQYKDGTIRNQNGQLLVLPESMKDSIITAETSEHYRSLRKQKILRAIEGKIQDVTRTNAPADAIAAIVGKRATIAMKDKTRTGNDAAKIVLSALDAYQDKAETRTNVLRNEYTIDDDTRRLLQRIADGRTDVLYDGDDRTNVLSAQSDAQITGENNTEEE
jgi:hypothetical protein